MRNVIIFLKSPYVDKGPHENHRASDLRCGISLQTVRTGRNGIDNLSRSGEYHLWFEAASIKFLGPSQIRAPVSHPRHTGVYFEAETPIRFDIEPKTFIKISVRQYRASLSNNGLGNRINASGMERVTTGNPFHGHYTAPGGTIAGNGLVGIFRTSRMKTAHRRQKRR